MKARLLIVPAILAVAVCGSANARSIQYDQGFWANSIAAPGDSVALTVNNMTFDFAPGITQAASSSAFDTPTPDNLPKGVMNEWEYNWGNADVSNPANPIAERVLVTESNSAVPVFTFDFLYASTSCPGETASFDLGSAKYTATNPCVSQASVTVTNGQITAQGLTRSGVTSAPELDPNSAVAELTLLAGGIAVVLGRRRLPVVSPV